MRHQLGSKIDLLPRGGRTDLGPGSRRWPAKFGSSPSGLRKPNRPKATDWSGRPSIAPSRRTRVGRQATRRADKGGKWAEFNVLLQECHACRRTALNRRGSALP